MVNNSERSLKELYRKIEQSSYKYVPAKKFDRLTHFEVLEKDLKVMDSTAASLCRDNNIDIHVFGISEDGNIMKAVCGGSIGTVIRN